ncbi:MAG: hypothetical protein ACOYOB_07370 [Myxococcota bacterium]
MRVNFGVTALPCAVLLSVLAACSGVRFDAADPSMRLRPISRKTVARAVDDPAQLEQPVVRMGVLHTSPGELQTSEATKELSEQAWRYGCDAVGPARREDTPKGPVWSCDCLRSAKFAWKGPAPAGSPVATPPPAVAETVPPATEAPATPAPAPGKGGKRKAEAAARKAEPAPERKAEPAAEPKAEPVAEPKAEASAPAPRPDPEEKARRAAASAELARRQRMVDEAERAAERSDAEAQRMAKLNDAARAREEARQAAAEQAKQKRDADRAEKARTAAETAELQRQRREAAAAEKAQTAEQAAQAKQQQRDAATAEKARLAEEAAEKDRLRREEAQAAKARKIAEAAEVERLKVEAVAQEKARKVAEAAEVERKRAEAERVARDEAEAQRKAAARQAIEDGNSPALLDYLARWPDGDDATRVFVALQRAAANESVNWLSDASVAASAEFVERRLPAPPTLAADLTEAKAKRWRWLVPKEVNAVFTLRNPTPHPVVLEVELGGTRVFRLVQGKQTLPIKQTLPCVCEANPAKSVQEDRLEYRGTCATSAAPRVVGMRPAEAELAVDKRACDPEVPANVVAKVWKIVTNTRMVAAHLDWLMDQLRRRADDMSQVDGSLTVLQKPVGGQPTPVRVHFRNHANRGLTVLYGVGTGRDERLLLPKGGDQEVLLKVLPDVAPDLRIVGLLPELRTTDWLLGGWTLGPARLALLPDASGELVAFALVADAGGFRTAVYAPVRMTGGVATWVAAVPAEWADAVLGKTPTCAQGCTMQLTLRLSDQERYDIGGARQLVVEASTGGKRAQVRFTSQW